jgi:hypothetical protein
MSIQARENYQVCTTLAIFNTDAYSLTLDPSVVTTPKISNPWSLNEALAATSNKPFEDTGSPVAFFHILERLKITKRAGWKRFGINQ